MELSRQMLLLTAVNYGSYYLHITKLPFFLRKGGKMGKDDDIFYDNHYNFADFP